MKSPHPLGLKLIVDDDPSNVYSVEEEHKKVLMSPSISYVSYHFSVKKSHVENDSHMIIFQVIAQKYEALKTAHLTMKLYNTANCNIMVTAKNLYTG